MKFLLLSDEQEKVSRAYDVLYPLIRIARRTTFVIDREGVVRQIQSGGEAADPDRTLPVCSLVNQKR